MLWQAVISLGTCFHLHHPQQLCIKVNSARGCCISTANAPRAFHILEEVDILINPLDDRDTAMDVILSSENEGVPPGAPGAKRTISSGHSMVDRP